MTERPVNREISKDLRTSDRIKLAEPAMIYQGQSSYPVLIFDMALEGFGTLSEVALPENENLFLDIPSESGVERYTCFITFCRLESDGFHLGLKIVEREEDVILIQDDAFDPG
ncbi:MAG: hypothetical protein HQL67_11850 [Magnetococcales bacterium]|nr:hypothetical protein [Magnetococcales bacterium]